MISAENPRIAEPTARAVNGGKDTKEVLRMHVVPWQANSKIHDRHHDRLAFIYVRQSDPQQVKHHRESTDLQYKLAHMAEDLGWPSERIVIVDEDLGTSGKYIEGREGFKRLIAEVGLDHAGIIITIGTSRLARSCKDWYHLLELCSRFGTVLADPDGIYDPSDFNDRLLLGLK